MTTKKNQLWKCAPVILILTGCEVPYQIQTSERGSSSENIINLQPGSLPNEPDPGSNGPVAAGGPGAPVQPPSSPSDVASPSYLGPGIWIKVSQVVISIEGAGSKPVVIRKNGEMVNLILLKEDVLKVLNVSLPVGKKVTDISMITADSGHRVISSSGADLCPDGVQIPAGTTSGFKLHLGSLEVKPNQSYKLVLDFTTVAPVTYFQNGGCQLHSNYQAN